MYLATDKSTNSAYACKSINKAKLVTEVQPGQPAKPTGSAALQGSAGVSAQGKMPETSFGRAQTPMAWQAMRAVTYGDTCRMRGS